MQITKIMNEIRNISTDPTDIKRVTEMLPRLCQFNNSDEMGKIPRKIQMTKPNTRIENRNSLTCIKEIEFII